MKHKWLWIILSLMSVVILPLLIYMAFKFEIFRMPSKRFIIIFSSILGGILIISLIIWGIFKIIRKRKYKTEETPAEQLKVDVNSKRAIDVWKEEFVKDNNIPYSGVYDDNGRLSAIIPINQKAVIIRNECFHADPSNQTADRFLRFEAHVCEGNRIGSLISYISVDRGEKYIRLNWNMRIQDNMTINRSKIKNEKLPPTSSNVYKERLESQRIKLMTEGGWTREETKEVLLEAPAQPAQVKRTIPVQAPMMNKEIEYVEAEEIEEDDEETPDSDKDVWRNR